MKRPKTTLLGNVLLLVIIVALFIILGEITIRVMGIDYFTDKTHQFDDKLGVIPIADISTTHQLLSGEAITRWTTNSKGFRTSEYQQENQNKVIVVFGDSFVEGYGVNNNEMFTHRLDQQLKDISVYPFGVSTFGTAQSYLMMENIIPEYKPEIVVLALFLGNDIWDNSLTLSDESKPYYVDKGFFYYGNVKPQETTIIKTLQFKIGKYSKFAGFVAHNLRKIMLTDTGNGNSFDKRYLIYNKTYDPEWQEAMNLTKTLLLKTKSLTSSHNTDLHILIIPAKETVDKGYQEKAIKQMPELANYNLDFEKPHRKIIQFLEENNIAYIDPLQSFKEGKERDKLYYPIDGHWTSKGHEVAALHIQGYLEKNV